MKLMTKFPKKKKKRKRDKNADVIDEEEAALDARDRVNNIVPKTDDIIQENDTVNDKANVNKKKAKKKKAAKQDEVPIKEKDENIKKKMNQMAKIAKKSWQEQFLLQTL